MTEKVQKILNEIERLINNHDSALDYEAALEDVRNFIDSLQEEPVSEDLEKAARNHAYSGHTDKASGERIAACIYDFKAGAQWQKAQLLAGDAIKEVKGSFGGEIKVDLYAKLDNGGYIDFDPGMKLNPACGVKIGNRVRIIVMED